MCTPDESTSRLEVVKPINERKRGRIACMHYSLKLSISRCRVENIDPEMCFAIFVIKSLNLQMCKLQPQQILLLYDLFSFYTSSSSYFIMYFNSRFWVFSYLPQNLKSWFKCMQFIWRNLYVVFLALKEYKKTNHLNFLFCAHFFVFFKFWVHKSHLALCGWVEINENCF